MSGSLRDRDCTLVPAGTPALGAKRAAALLVELPGWEIVEGHHLRRVWDFPDFLSALAFVNRIGELAEAQQHHPDIALSWGRAAVEIWTHTVGGLSETDFILAAKLEDLPR